MNTPNNASTLTPQQHEDLQNSITVIKHNKNVDGFLHMIKNRIDNPTFANSYIIAPENSDSTYGSFKGLDDACDILVNNPNAKILMIGTYSSHYMLKKTHEDVRDKFVYALSFPNVRYLSYPCSKEEINTVLDISQEQIRAKDVQDSLTILWSEGTDDTDLQYKKIIDDIKKEVNNMDLYKAHIIRAERKKPDAHMQNMPGLDDACRILQEDPKAKVVICSLFKPEVLEKRGKANAAEKWAYINSFPNVKFLEIPFSAEALNNAFSEKHIDIKKLQDSIHFVNKSEMRKGYDEELKTKITNPQMQDVNIVCAELDSKGEVDGNMPGLDIALDLLQKDPQKKIVVTTFLGTADFEKNDKWKVIHSFSNVRYIRLPFDPEELNNVYGSQATRVTITQEAQQQAFHTLNAQAIGYIRHGLEPYKIKDPYNPIDEREKQMVQKAIEETKKHFPSRANRTDKQILDFILQAKLDIPEKMKGQFLKGVYVDIDGTLIDYVEAGSPLEGTQQLRTKVVEYVQDLEKQGYTITIRTGGKVAEKEAQLRALSIPENWPVVSKYDYAGATAEIVIDDIDPNTLFVQNKLIGKQHIDTSKR